MRKDIKIILENNIQKSINAIGLVIASINSIKPFNPSKNYNPKELEPYDALSDRFTRSIEISIKFFRSYELYMFAEGSDTYRDLLNRMAKLDFISSVSLWMEMRYIRNRIAHDYLPEEIEELYSLIKNNYGKELKTLQKKLKSLNL